MRSFNIEKTLAAVVASFAGKANSISTIFTLDIYKPYLHPGGAERQIVWIGKFAIVVAMAVAAFLAPRMGIGAKGGFQYIQEYTGFGQEALHTSKADIQLAARIDDGRR